MATKTEIQSKINEINNGGLNTAAEVRDVLGTHNNSILESVYGTEITETHETVGGITIPNADFEYTAIILKQGRKVFLKGGFECLNSGFTTIFSINNTEYNPTMSISDGFGVTQNNEFSRFSIVFNPITNNFDFKINSSLLAEERLYYSITYNTEN